MRKGSEIMKLNIWLVRAVSWAFILTFIIFEIDLFEKVFLVLITMGYTLLESGWYIQCNEEVR